MDNVKDPIIAAVRELMAANDAVQEALVEGNGVLQRGLDYLESGGGITEALKSLPISFRREATQSALKRSIDARHELRLLAIAVCIDDGMPPTDIAEIWGVSRQRVDQYVQELKKRTASESA